MTGRGKELVRTTQTQIRIDLSLVPWKSRKPRGIPTFPQQRLLLSTGSRERTKTSTPGSKCVNFVPGCTVCGPEAGTTASRFGHDSIAIGILLIAHDR